MKGLSKLKLKTRLILSYVVLIVLTFSIIYASIFESTRIRADYTEVLVEDVTVLHLLQDVKADINSVAYLLRDQIVLGYDDDSMEYISSIAYGLYENINAINAIRPDDPKSTEFLGAVDAWFATLTELDAAIAEGNQAKISALIRDQDVAALSQVQIASDNLIELVNQEMNDKIALSKSTSNNAQIFFYAAALIAFIISIIIAVRIVRSITIPLKTAEVAILELSKGNLSQEVPETEDNEIGQICNALRQSQTMLNEIISDITNVTQKIVEGDLTYEIEQEYHGEFSPIKENLQAVMTYLAKTVQALLITADEIAVGSEQMSNNAQILAQGASQQSAAISDLSNTIITISKNSKANGESAQQADEMSGKAGELVVKSGEGMAEMRVAMEDILQSQNSIGEIISAIENISFQTNILALNAAVEAARAGSAGKGFAVVADEVRNLASKSDQAAKQTKKLIDNSLVNVERGSEIVKNVADLMDQTMSYAGKAVESINVVTNASVSEAKSIEQLTAIMDQISSVVETNSSSSEESAAASEQLSAQVYAMRGMVDKFRLSKDAPLVTPTDDHMAPRSHVDIDLEEYYNSTSDDFDMDDKY